MPESSAVPEGLVLRLSVPASGDLRQVAADVAAKIAEYLGDRAPDVAAALVSVASRVAPAGTDRDIAFEFRKEGGELLIEARSGAESSEVRCPLPA
jgi:hypothetical protein